MLRKEAGTTAGGSILFYFSNNQPPSKRALTEEQSGRTEQQQAEQQQRKQQQAEQQREQQQREQQQRGRPQEQQRPEKSKAMCGAATYRCVFKNEWTTTWLFITRGSLSTHYWCSVCRVENTCCHQGVTDVVRHIKSKSHQGKQQALQSTATLDRFSVSTPSVGGMSDQEAKVCYVLWSCQGSRINSFV